MTGTLGRSLRRAVHHPAVHFALIGAALLAGWGAVQRAVQAVPRAPTRAPIVISAERIRLLQTQFEERWGARPSPISSARAWNAPSRKRCSIARRARWLSTTGIAASAAA
jgi:hypothetical protein